MCGYAEEEEMNVEKGAQGSRKRTREANTEEASERTVKKQKPETDEAKEEDLTLPDDFDNVDKSKTKQSIPHSLPSEPPPKPAHETSSKKKQLVPPQLRSARANVVTEDYESWSMAKSKTKEKHTENN